MQAIQTKYLPCTDYKPSRVKAWCQAGSLTLSWDHGLNDDENHARVAQLLAEQLGWTGDKFGHLIGGGLPSGGCAFVFTTKPL